MRPGTFATKVEGSVSDHVEVVEEVDEIFLELETAHLDSGFGLVVEREDDFSRILSVLFHSTDLFQLFQDLLFIAIGLQLNPKSLHGFSSFPTGGDDAETVQVDSAWGSSAFSTLFKH